MWRVKIAILFGMSWCKDEVCVVWNCPWCCVTLVFKFRLIWFMRAFTLFCCIALHCISFTFFVFICLCSRHSNSGLFKKIVWDRNAHLNSITSFGSSRQKILSWLSYFSVKVWPSLLSMIELQWCLCLCELILLSDCYISCLLSFCHRIPFFILPITW